MNEFLPPLLFAEDKTIHGKKDDKKHEGKASEVRRIQEANSNLNEALKDLPKPKPKTGK